jgi:hypothetical protein
MEESEAHLFEQDDDERKERNGEDIEEEEWFGHRSDDGSDSPGSLGDFIEQDQATPIDILAYAAFDMSRDQEVPLRRTRPCRRIVVSIILVV